MELLQAIDKLNNIETDCPVRISRCELLSDSENVRVSLHIKLKAAYGPISHVRLDICCYGPDGSKLSAINDVQYKKGGIELEVPSLMTAAAAIIVRSAILEDGTNWRSDSVFPDSVEVAQSEPAVSDDTARFDSSALIEPNGQADFIEAPKTRKERREARKQRFREEEEIREFIKHDPTERKKRIIARLLTLILISGAICGGVYALKYNQDSEAAYKKAMNLYNSGKFEDAVGELEKAERYVFFGDKKKELDWSLAMSYARQRDFYDAGKYFKSLNGYIESRENYRSIIEAYSGITAAGRAHTLALKSDGTVLAAGNNNKKQCDVSKWRDVTKLAAGGDHSVALMRDARVTATGDDTYGQCSVSSWKNISDIAAGSGHTVGITKQGRAVAAGDNTYGQCDVENWSGIVSVSAGDTHTVGLKIDGTVIATGDNSHGECNISQWNDIVSVCAGNGFTVGLKYDGRIVFAGDDSRGISEATKAKDTYFISCGASNVIVTSADGHTQAFGGNDSNQCMTDLWKNIAAAAGGERHSIGISVDGTAFGVGANDSGQLDLSGWNGIGIPKSTVAIRKGS